MHSPFSFWNSLKFLIALRGHYTSYKRNYPESSRNGLYEAYGRSEGYLRSGDGIKLHRCLYRRSCFEENSLSNPLEKRHCQHLPSMVKWNSGKHSWQEWMPPLFCTRKGIHKRGGGVNDSVRDSLDNPGRGSLFGFRRDLCRYTACLSRTEEQA